LIRAEARLLEALPIAVRAVIHRTTF